MILIIDNYDSFTYNLVQYFGELGEKLMIRRNDEITLQEIETAIPRLSAAEFAELERFVREQRARKVEWPDFAARRRRIFPDGPPPGPPLSEIVCKARGKY